jgi:hypothetical protein
MNFERHFRLAEISSLTGYKVATLRAKIRRGELAGRRLGRIVVVAEGDLKKFVDASSPKLMADE